MIKIQDDIKQIINSRESLKALATIGKDGKPHLVFKGSISINDEGFIVYDEVIENSQTNKNVLYSLWFKKEVAINILSPEKKSYQIKGIPVKTLINGSEYEKHYVAIQERHKDTDLGAVYFIEPTEIIDESFLVQKAKYEAEEPLYIHLDRLVD